MKIFIAPQGVCGKACQCMKNLLVRWLVLAFGVVFSAKLVPGISYDSIATLAVVVIILSFLNAILKPLLLLLTLPFVLVTAGVGVWLINALLFFFTAKLVDGFHVAGFGSALWGALIVSITNMMMNRMLISKKLSSPPAGGPRCGGHDNVIDI